MVIRNEEPDIAVGGDPSAPSIATAVPATAFASDPNKNIERTTNADGSLMVKVTTTARQPNGYRELTIEYFYVPANMADTVIMAMDATGEPPSSLYMTKMEQQVLPPGTSEVISHAPPTAAAAPAAVTVTSGGGGYNPTPQTYTAEHTVGSSNNGCKRACGIFCAFALVFVLMGSIVSAIRRDNMINNWPTPAPYSYPSPWYPTPPTARPTIKGCKDTPGWVDMMGSGCDYYENKYYSVTDRCGFSHIYEGSMGPADENCCTCGGGSTYVAPTPWPSIAPVPTIAPSPRPTQPSACVDTPDWKDLFGAGCDLYTGGLCDFSLRWQGAMGPADKNCCVCGGGTVPSNPTKTPTISSSAVPTVVSKNDVGVTEMDSSSSYNNPFRSPSAAKEDRR